MNAALSNKTQYCVVSQLCCNYKNHIKINQDPVLSCVSGFAVNPTYSNNTQYCIVYRHQWVRQFTMIRPVGN